MIAVKVLEVLDILFHLISGVLQGAGWLTVLRWAFIKDRITPKGLAFIATLGVVMIFLWHIAHLALIFIIGSQHHR